MVGFVKWLGAWLGLIAFLTGAWALYHLIVYPAFR